MFLPANLIGIRMRSKLPQKPIRKCLFSEKRLFLFYLESEENLTVR